MKTTTYIEQGALKAHAPEIARLGRRALIVTGRNSSKTNGSLQDLQNVLENTNTEYIVFDRISENPPVDEIAEARDVGISKGCDFVIGLGGGSPMDAAKAVSILLFQSNKDLDYLYQSPAFQDTDKDGQTLSFPVICIPTTCGTGSEATGVSVLSRPDLGTKKSLPHRVFPSLSLLDPTYLMYAPHKVLRNTAIDAMAHLIESYINTSANTQSRSLCINGLKLWSHSKDVILGKRKVGYIKNEHPENISDYVKRTSDPEKAAADEITDMKILTDMLTAANIAGQAIAITGTSIPHALSYRLTYGGGIAHGPATGIFQPGFMHFADDKTKKTLLRAMDFIDMDSFKEFLGSACDISGISEIDYSILVENSIKDFLSDESRIKKVPYEVNREVLEMISGGC